jgi:hypothetical protein
MLTLLLLVSLGAVFAWFKSEFTARPKSRLVLGVAALCLAATTAFLFGRFVEGLKSGGFPIPGDSPADAARMDAASKAANNGSNN